MSYPAHEETYLTDKLCFSCTRRQWYLAARWALCICSCGASEVRIDEQAGMCWCAFAAPAQRTSDEAYPRQPPMERRTPMSQPMAPTHRTQDSVDTAQTDFTRVPVSQSQPSYQTQPVYEPEPPKWSINFRQLKSFSYAFNNAAIFWAMGTGTGDPSSIKILISPLTAQWYLIRYH